MGVGVSDAEMNRQPKPLAEQRCSNDVLIVFILDLSLYSLCAH